jgi:hypothetical protein
MQMETVWILTDHTFAVVKLDSKGTELSVKVSNHMQWRNAHWVGLVKKLRAPKN